MPLIARHGEAVGTLCLLDYKPRTFAHLDLELLAVFGRCVLGAFEWREHKQSPEIPEGAFRYLQLVDEDLDVFGKPSFLDIAAVEGARAAALREQITCVALAVPARRLAEVVSELRARRPFGIIGRLGHARLGWLVRGMDEQTARDAALAVGGPHSFAEAAELGAAPGTVGAAVQQLEALLGDAGLA